LSVLFGFLEEQVSASDTSPVRFRTVEARARAFQASQTNLPDGMVFATLTATLIDSHHG
jgi:hypothetical protein